MIGRQLGHDEHRPIGADFTSRDADRVFESHDAAASVLSDDRKQAERHASVVSSILIALWPLTSCSSAILNPPRWNNVSDAPLSGLMSAISFSIRDSAKA